MEYCTQHWCGSPHSIADSMRAVIRYCEDKAFFFFLEKMNTDGICDSFYNVYRYRAPHQDDYLFFEKIGKLPKDIASRILSFNSKFKRVAIVLCKIFISYASIPSQAEIAYLFECNFNKKIHRHVYRLCASWKKTKILKMLLKEEIEKEKRSIIFFIKNYSIKEKKILSPSISIGEKSYFRFIVKNIISKKEEKY